MTKKNKLDNYFFNSQQKLIAKYRLESQLQRQIALFIKTKLHHITDLQKITISKVKLTADHHAADVFYTTLDFKQRFKIDRQLNKNRTLIGIMITQKLKLRRGPRINFKFDHHLVKTNQLEKIIDKF